MRLPHSTLARFTDFLEKDAYPWWQEEVCKRLPPAAREPVMSIPVLLSGIFMSLQRLTDALAQGGNYWRSTPYTAIANEQAIKILDKEPNGRVREVAIWVDDMSGGPFPTIRVTNDAAGGAGAGGISIRPGSVNELGKVPPDTVLYLSSSVTCRFYLIERA